VTNYTTHTDSKNFFKKLSGMGRDTYLVTRLGNFIVGTVERILYKNYPNGFLQNVSRVTVIHTTRVASHTHTVRQLSLSLLLLPVRRRRRRRYTCISINNIVTYSFVGKLTSNRLDATIGHPAKVGRHDDTRLCVP